MDPSHQAIIAQAISLLQSLGTPAAKRPSAATVSMPEFEFALSACITNSKTLAPQIQKLSDIYATAAKHMMSIMQYSTISPQPNANEEEMLKKLFTDLSEEITKIEKKTGEYVDHCRAVRELLSTTFWVFVNTPEFIIKGAIESADFHALKFQKKKVQEHNEWYRNLQAASRALEKYVNANNAAGLVYQHTGASKWTQLFAVPTDQQKQPILEQKLPPVEPKKQPEEKQVKRKQLVGQNWNISNYVNETIEFLEGEVQMKNAVFIENCKGITLQLDSKLKSLQFNKCENVVASIQSCVSGIEVMNCRSVKLFVKQVTPSVAVDKSASVRILLNEKNLSNCEIVSSKAAQLSVSYQKDDGNESKDFSVCEQLLTKWNPVKGSFETTLYDKFL